MDTAIFLSYFVPGVVIFVRAIQEGSILRFPFFHSFLFYFLLTAAVGLIFQLSIPVYFPHVFWFRFLSLVVAEFVLLIQIGDHIFASRPLLRSLGRLMTFGISVVFSIVFILPPLLESRPTEVAVFDLVLRSALTKGIILLVLGLMAIGFGIRLGGNIIGIAVGLMAYLSVNIANFSLVESLGWDTYGQVFTLVGPMSQTLMLLIWAVALWRYHPAPQPKPAGVEEVRPLPEPLPDRLGRYNTELDRLLRR